MKIIIGLLSCEQHSPREKLCRDTWIPKATELGIDVVFIRGGADKPTRDGDILTLPTPTDYKTLPQRTRAFCRWLLENTDADFAFKADNDTFICPERLLACDLWGPHHYFGNEPGGRFLGYCSGGGGYGISRMAAQYISSLMAVDIGAEDVWVCRTLKAKGIPPYLDPKKRFVAWGCDEDRRIPRKTNDVITAHQISTDLWMRIYNDLYQS